MKMVCGYMRHDGIFRVGDIFGCAYRAASVVEARFPHYEKSSQFVTAARVFLGWALLVGNAVSCGLRHDRYTINAAAYIPT